MSRTRSAVLVLIAIVVVFCFLAVALTESDDGGSLVSGLLVADNKVGVVPIKGAIASCDDVLKQLRKFQRKSSVKAVILRIDSPGGSVAPAQEIYREVERTREKKPVIASIETVGASAAYYIASAADRIVCSQGSITGSIGVIMMLADVQEIANRIGVKIRIIKAGKYKDIGSMLRPFSDEERKILETFAKEVHEQFIQDVAAGRKGKIEITELRKIANGSFFTGATAKEYGLVDQMGNFYDAVNAAAELGGIEGKPELIYPEKEWPGYLDVLFESAAKSFVGILTKPGVLVTAPALQ